ncbi:MAG: hypothetical protein ACRCTR_07580 [Actinomycetota bacterium]
MPPDVVRPPTFPRQSNDAVDDARLDAEALPVRPQQSWWSRPGWPLTVMMVPFPLWWALGISEFICLLMAIPMAAYLVQRRRVEVPRGFGLWLLFLLWVAVGVFVLNVAAYGAVPDNSPTRYFTWAYRFGWYLTVTVVFLYVLNTRADLSVVRMCRIVSALFFTVVAGGILGVVAPTFQFPSLLELALPESLSKVEFVYRMIHPSAAQLQDVLGFASPRPSAPYAYTNTWGLNFVCTLPFFLFAWLGREAGRRRYAAPVILLIAAVPAVFSINRSMWGALICMALLVAVRAALTGRLGTLIGVVVTGVAVVSLVAFTSLGSLVSTRLTSAGSEEGRASLGSLSVVSVTETSPVIGLGSTRNVQGNFNTITGGTTAECPRCSPPALGTQGQLWLVVFCQGLLGLIFYLGFFALMAWRSLSLHTPTTTLALTVLLASVVTMPFYNSLGTGLLVIMVATALGIREQVIFRGSFAILLPLRVFIDPLRRWWFVVGALTMIGVGSGALVHVSREDQVSAVASATLPPRSIFSFVTSDGPVTLDTLAQLLFSDQVLSAVERTTRIRPAEGDGTLVVRAAPNSRTLSVTFIAPDSVRAEAGSRAAVEALLRVREQQLIAERERQLEALNARAKALSANVAQLNALIDRPGSGTSRAPFSATMTLRQRRTQLQVESKTISQQIAEVVASPVEAGSVVRTPQSWVNRDPLRVDMATGLATGLGTGGVFAVMLGPLGARIGRRRTIIEAGNLPVLVALPRAAKGEWVVNSDVLVLVNVHHIASAIPVGHDAAVIRFAAVLGQLPQMRRIQSKHCVLVAHTADRGIAVARAITQAKVRGEWPIGVIVLESPPKRRWRARRATRLNDSQDQERIKGVSTSN